MNMQTSNLTTLYDKYILGNYPAAPFTLVKGQGTKVWDDTGKEYLDFGTGIAVNGLGHCHPYWVKRIQEQATELIHCTNLYRFPQPAKLAEKLAKYTGPGKFFFCNSGAEANEALIKLARLYGTDKAGEEGKSYKIIGAENAFHGRTFGGMSATPLEKIQKGFRPLLDGFSFGQINNLESFSSKIDEHTVAIYLEPTQGESGVLPCDAEFLQGIRKLCDEHNLLLMLDEVQTGVGRTGRFFGYEHAGIVPDAIAMAKGLGGGFPVGAIWISDKYAGLFTPGTHGSTYGGNPLACTAALSVLEVMEKENLLDRVAESGTKLKASLCKLADKYPQHIAEVRGQGYLLGIGMKEDPTDFINSLFEKGLITVPAGANTVRIYPPFNVSDDEIKSALDILEQTLEDLK